jgi:putative ubiquitin-RnfH superfamily antitoxin RatB of RatAB toxin-antitoxin module
VKVTLCWSPGPRDVREVPLDLPAGSTVADALRAANVPIDLSHPQDLGVWGRRASLDQALVDADRVELYRALTVDPKVARRERFRKQGARGTGLFANRRPGAKSGY